MRQSKLQGTWKSYTLDITWLDTSTLFLSSCKIAESIRRASLGGMRSTLTSQTLRQQVTMALMRFWKRHSFSMYTPCNQIYFIWCWTHFSYTNVQLISEVQMLLQCCFAVQYPSQSGERNIEVNSTQSTSNIPWLWYVLLSGAEKTSENRLCHR